MNNIDRIRKSLADVKTGEKGWRKVLATSEGSFSKTLAEKNLRRLAALRQTLLAQLNPTDAHRQPGFEAAMQHEMIADDRTESVSERLLRQN